MERVCQFNEAVVCDRKECYHCGWDPEVAKAVSYYDNASFAKRVKCPINVSTGLYDRTCVPTSVLAVYNSIPETTQKWLTFVPDGAHGAHHKPADNRRADYIEAAVKESAK